MPAVRINLEGSEAPIPFSVLVDHPELKHIGSNQKYLRPSALHFCLGLP